jgi:hypothetical protein
MSIRRMIDDRTAGALMAGTPTSDDLIAVAAFVSKVRAVGAEPPPVPASPLASILAHGFSTDNGDLPATAASNVLGPARQVSGLPKRRNKMPIPQFIAGLSLAGKIALGAGVAAAATTGAAAVGSLPDPAQNAVSDVVGTVTPFEFPSSKANANADFGGAVSTDARDGGVDGQSVSEMAREQFGSGNAASAGKPDETPAASGGQSSAAAATANAGVAAEAGLDTASATAAGEAVPPSVPPVEVPAAGANAGVQSAPGRP